MQYLFLKKKSDAVEEQDESTRQPSGDQTINQSDNANHHIQNIYKNKKTIAFGILIGFIFCIIGFFSTHSFNPETVGIIIRPNENQIVSIPFKYEITIRDYNQEKYYYLANQIEGHYWCKEVLYFNKSQIYKGQINEGYNKPFNFIIFEVGKAEHLRLQAWLEHGKNTGDFPGISYIDGIQLDRKTIRPRA